MKTFIGILFLLVLAGCLISLPEDFLSSLESYEDDSDSGSESYEEYKDEICYTVESFFSCFANSLKKAENYEDFKDSLNYSCGSRKEFGDDLKDVQDKAENTLLEEDYLNLTDWAKELSYIMEDNPVDRCKRKDSNNKRANCILDKLDIVLEDAGCQ